MLQCPAAAAQGADLETRIHQVQRRIAAGSAALPGPFGHGVMLNNAGFNYGGSSREVDPGALSFEAKLAH
jgi:hypothetical protein